MERIRSFIAVGVPPEKAGKLRTTLDQLRSADPGVKWVNPDGFHITLKFLGGIEKERLSLVWSSVRDALDGMRRFQMSFRGIGVFPSLNRARVVWAGVADGAQELRELAARVEQVCAKHGFEREKRPFAAHLTLGRARQVGVSPELAALMKRLVEVELGKADVNSVQLLRSELTPQGAIYHEMEHKQLMGEGGER